jgi:DNA polymerase elongation subunit (family B)
VRAFELFDGHPLDASTIKSILNGYRLVTFNGANFDIPLLMLALKTPDNAIIKKACDSIINNNLRGWQFERQWDVVVPKDLDHIDLIEIAPGTASLKIYGGRMHCLRMQDLPIEPTASIAPEQRELMREYCANDLVTTQDLYERLLPQIELRHRMSEEYALDLRSKSDAQIAEAVIGRQVADILQTEIKRPEVAAGTKFTYRPPEFIQFTTPALQDVLERLRTERFVVPDSGKVTMPKWLQQTEIKIGTSVYRMGIGGLHSSEQSVAHVADEDTILVDRDVASYYPNIILRMGLAPSHMGSAFTKTYRDIVERRLHAKATGDKVTDSALKITINGSFGKFGSKWSKLYSPDLLIQTTMTGQLALLMLIETLESEGIPVVSANTDGVVMKCPKARVAMMEFVAWEWEHATGFTTEATYYRALYSKDVNNYVAIKPDGGFKLKGVYAPAGLQKNPTNEICTGAVVKHLLDGTSVADTIRACKDIRKFVTIRQVKGGAVKGDAYLGKAVRWYYAKGATGTINYKVNGYTVARSEGAQPLMQIPDSLPTDIDYAWYIAEAQSILDSIGAA